MTVIGKDYATGQPVEILEDIPFSGKDVLKKGTQCQIVNIVNADEMYLIIIDPVEIHKGVFVIKANEKVGPIPIEHEGKRGIIKEVDMISGRLPTRVIWDDGSEELLLPEGAEDEMPD